ncbi:oxygen-dependent choline dehydrogenase [Rhodoferax lithotrophicus]|uniref:Oxygen-dependent choline dehydrogenase n=1 Tax=Rhodoferax lithotrophicus TaxID=2798804 RepID=A0ABM7MPW8_9BURK|nr:GMC oxidoreductase [Rhodoferax sp. MIZ03]BCO28391.1 oxygen-dependent choline dehydrogenase [Rhodoferax sp. MIZ03]
MALQSIRCARTMATSPAMRPFVKREVKPGPELSSDADLLEFCRNHRATIFHPVGTCRMEADVLAVVDPRLRVNGITGLRVVDCCVMPTLVSGNTYAAAVMLAEKAADLVREDGALLMGLPV